MDIFLTLIIKKSKRDEVLASVEAGNIPSVLQSVKRMITSDTLNRELIRAGVKYSTVYALIDDSELDDILAAYPGSEVVEIRVYNTGLHFGQSFDDEGVVIGTRIYPAHPDHLEICPDIITYSGNPPIETSRARPTEISYQLSIAGAAKRIG